jgi:hypothetical protein
VREQEQTLYGFATGDERDLFRLLINRVTGDGPKMGLAILSGMSVRDFKRHVVHGDIAALSKISGVGKKTAERIILELKDKVGVAEAWKDAAPQRRHPRPHQSWIPASRGAEGGETRDRGIGRRGGAGPERRIARGAPASESGVIVRAEVYGAARARVTKTAPQFSLFTAGLRREWSIRTPCSATSANRRRPPCISPKS